MENKLHSVYDIGKSPRMLIEASAGTGKTYTIVGLFVRLLAEEELSVDQLLVVTFTKKATSELRDRILKRLRESVQCLTTGEAGNDTFLAELLNHTNNREETAAKLKQAIRDFDECSVFTIHGFCQKILKEEALVAGVPFEAEITPRDELFELAAGDYWRNTIDRYSGSQTGRYLLNKLFSMADSPSALTKLLQPLFSKPFGRPEGDRFDDPEKYTEELLALRNEMKQVWFDEREQLLDILWNCDISGHQTHLQKWINDLEELLLDENLEQDTTKMLERFTSGYLYDDNNLKNGGNPVPRHRFFEVCNSYYNHVAEADKLKTTLFYDAFEEVSRRREELAGASPKMTYDDLLQTVKQALENPKTGNRLAARIQQKYPYALVDEFQDTDPVQFAIFDKIYPKDDKNGCLVMIGDPKQAIYAFRGADLYAYIDARESVQDTHFTLRDNYRSRPRLIEAINNLFGRDDGLFIEEKVHFSGSDSGKPDLEEQYLLEGETPVPFTFTVTDGVFTNKDQAKQQVFRDMVNQVAELLQKSENGQATIEGRKLEAGDIAILIHSHKDAETIKRLLKQAGIDAVTYSREKVFSTFEAKRLDLLMGAVLQPHNKTALHNALVSGFFGLDANRLAAIKNDEEERQTISEELESLNKTWTEKGFYPMFRKLLYTNNRLAGFAEMDNAERVITNLYQLADIASYTEREGGFSPQALHNWFRKEIADPSDDDERTLLLESDQNLVKISTIHNSKGLEFPVVFCPALWEGRRPSLSRLKTLEYHDDSGELVIHIGQHNSDERDEAFSSYKVESIAEEVRKTYVALTRAKYECRVHWASHTESNLTGLGAVLLGREQFLQNIDEKVKEKGPLTDSSFTSLIRKHAEHSPESIAFLQTGGSDVEIKPVKLAKSSAGRIESRPYTGRKQLPVKKAMESFSSLVHHQDTAGEPDYDQYIDDYAESVQAAEPDRDSLNIFRFPRGADAGTLIHKLFEHPQFDFTEAAEADYEEIVLEVLEQHGFDEKWSDVLQQLIRSVVTADAGELKLSDVKPGDHIREMEFHLPVSHLQSDQLFRIIREGGRSEPLPSDLETMLTGFIDLVVRQNGKYYILDYKSNHLGDSAEDYSQETMTDAVNAAGYDLQYHLYTAALVRYLEKHDPDFDYSRNFGGVYYLFVRGMVPGETSGVLFNKPDQQVIRNLLNYLYRPAEVQHAE